MERRRPFTVLDFIIAAIVTLAATAVFFVPKDTGLAERVDRLERQPIIITVKVYPQPDDKPMTFKYPPILPGITPDSKVPASVQKFLDGKAK